MAAGVPVQLLCLNHCQEVVIVAVLFVVTEPRVAVKVVPIAALLEFKVGFATVGPE